jgi:uncharacterized membrane protein
LLALAVAPFLLATVVGVALLWPPSSRPPLKEELLPGTAMLNATVADVAQQGDCGGGQHCYSATVELTSGPDRGHTTTLSNLTRGPGLPVLQVGDRVVVTESVDTTDGTSTYAFADFQRRGPLIWLVVLFSVLVVGVARWRGLAAIAGLGATAAVLLRFVIPGILHGENPVAVTLVGGSVIMFVVLYLAHGFNGRTTIALLGTLGSLALTAVLAELFVGVTHLTGASSEEAVYVQVLNNRIQLSGLLLGGILIGSLGVLNDVTVTQASAVWEIHLANPSRRMVDLWRSGMRVGRDHIASVVYTLVLAYAGAALPLLLIFSVSRQTVGSILTSDVVAEELVRTLVGSVGLVASVPVTTALAAFVVTRASARAAPELNDSRAPTAA